MIVLSSTAICDFYNILYEIRNRFFLFFVSLSVLNIFAILHLLLPLLPLHNCYYFCHCNRSHLVCRLTHYIHQFYCVFRFAIIIDYKLNQIDSILAIFCRYFISYSFRLCVVCLFIYFLLLSRARSYVCLFLSFSLIYAEAIVYNIRSLCAL